MGRQEGTHPRRPCYHRAEAQTPACQHSRASETGQKRHFRATFPLWNCSFHQAPPQGSISERPGLPEGTSGAPTPYIYLSSRTRFRKRLRSPRSNMDRKAGISRSHLPALLPRKCRFGRARRRQGLPHHHNYQVPHVTVGPTGTCGGHSSPGSFSTNYTNLDDPRVARPTHGTLCHELEDQHRPSRPPYDVGHHGPSLTLASSRIFATRSRVRSRRSRNSGGGTELPISNPHSPSSWASHPQSSLKRRLSRASRPPGLRLPLSLQLSDLTGGRGATT